MFELEHDSNSNGTQIVQDSHSGSLFYPEIVSEAEQAELVTSNCR